MKHYNLSNMVDAAKQEIPGEEKGIFPKGISYLKDAANQIRSAIEPITEAAERLFSNLGGVRTIVSDGPTREALTEIGIDIIRNAIGEVLGRAKNVITEKLTSTDNSQRDNSEIEPIEGKKIVVWLVHPTNYRPDGTPRKWEKQILPTNFIGQLHALIPKKIKLKTEDEANEKEVRIEVRFLEDTAQPFDIDEIERSMEGEETKGIVMLGGVQTNQWPRAMDLASLCQERDIPVIAGGYHVRADLPITQIQAQELGISLAIGEAESMIDGKPLLENILTDLWNGNLKSEYRQAKNPGIEDERISDVLPEYQRLMITPDMITLETSRGCPQPCRFCTIRVIGGDKVRSRAPHHMKEWLEENYNERGVRKIFITDDNFAKSKQRTEVLEIFKEFKRRDMAFQLMIQVDTTATLGEAGKQFIKDCQEAGVQAVFLGIESVDPQTLEFMDKPQNHPDRYKEMISQWHAANIMTQCGFIIGNPGEKPGVGKRSAQALIEMGMDVAAAYIRAPLPGSVDYHHFNAMGWIKESDFNQYDCHSDSCIEFPDGLTREQVMQEYKEFYEEFFKLENLTRMSRRLKGDALKAAMRQFFWYKIAILQGDHPMYSGLGRMDPDFKRSEFPYNVPTLEEIKPRPDGPGDPRQQKRQQGLEEVIEHNEGVKKRLPILA